MLCDFGLARIVATVKSGLTDPGRPKFTPRYASPELFRGESTDNPLPRDVWAWGCLLLVVCSAFPLASLTATGPFIDYDGKHPLRRVPK